MPTSLQYFRDGELIELPQEKKKSAPQLYCAKADEWNKK
jgi:hypothetical protein